MADGGGGVGAGWWLERRFYTSPTIWQARAEAAASVLKDAGYEVVWDGDMSKFEGPNASTWIGPAYYIGPDKKAHPLPDVK